LTTISGGTLKLGTGGTSGSVGGDISIGSGATLELNRSDKISFTKVLSGSGNFSLKGGQIELLAANTFTGTVALSAGTTLTVGSGGSLLSSVSITNNGTFEYNNSSSTYSLGAMSGSGNLSILASTVNQTGVNSITGGVSISSGATYAIGTSGSFSSASSVVNNGTLSFGTLPADYTLAQAMSGNGNLISALGSGRTLFLTGANTYTGTTTINSGIVNMGNGGSTGMIGAGAVTIASGAELQIARSDDITLFNTISGAGKITLGGAGKITLDSTSSVNITGELKFGTTAGSAIHSSLDLTNASLSVGTFKVQTDATANTALYNSIIIGAGKSLTVNGLTTIGLDNASNPTTNLTMTGDGTFNIGTSTTATNANVNVGASLTASRVNYVNWDMSGLANLVMNLGTGTFSIGADVNSTGTSNGTGSGVTVKLAKNSTITASTLLMDSMDALRTFTLSLGSGTNLLNVDTINIAGPTNSRATSQINFNSGDGTLVLRNKAGNGRATLNVQYATNSTGNNQVGLFDVSGHSADLLLGTVIVGERLNLAGAGAGYGSGYLAFDTGTFDATTLNIANKSHNGTATATLVGKTGSSNLSGNIVGLASFGGGNVILGTVDVARHGATTGTNPTPATVQGLIEFLGTNSSTLGAVTIATASSSLNYSVTATGSFNVAGGSVYASSIRVRLPQLIPQPQPM
jgi:autotransporter-associated beta strand protein